MRNSKTVNKITESCSCRKILKMKILSNLTKKLKQILETKRTMREVKQRQSEQNVHMLTHITKNLSEMNYFLRKIPQEYRKCV